MEPLAIIYIVLTVLFLLTKSVQQENAAAFFSLVSWFTALALAIVVMVS